MASQQEESTSPAGLSKSSANNWLKRSLERVEPLFQHEGFVYTFVIAHMFMNIIIFFMGAAPAWRKGADIDFPLRMATTVSRGSGAMLNYNSALVILVASRSLMTFLRRTMLNMFVPFDKAMPAFHSLIGNCIVIATGMHVLGHVFRYSIMRLHGPGFFGPVSLAISGSLLTITLLAMRVTSTIEWRRTSFELFYWVHRIGAICFYVLIMMHGSHIGTLKTYMYVSGPIFIYIMDQTVRLFNEKGRQISIMHECAYVIGDDIVCLRIPRTFSYLAGQYCEINVPLVSRSQWHPFTIASSPHERDMVFFIKVNGDWTRAVHELIKTRRRDVNGIWINVSGPHGAPAQHVGQYDHVVLISGGIGATPFASITKYIEHWIRNFTSRGKATSKPLSSTFTRNQTTRKNSSVPQTAKLTSSKYRSTAQKITRPFQQNSPSQCRKSTHSESRNQHRQNLQDRSTTFAESGPSLFQQFNSRPNIAAKLDASLSRPSGLRSDRGDLPRSHQLSGSSSKGLQFSQPDHNVISQKWRKTGNRRDIQSHENWSTGPPSLFGRVRSPTTSTGGVFDGIQNDSEFSITSGIERRLPEDLSLRRYLDMEASTEDDAFHAENEDIILPADYDEKLGNHFLPAPNRFHKTEKTRTALHREKGRSENMGSLGVVMEEDTRKELPTEYDSSQTIFDDDEERVEEEVPAEDVRHMRQRLGLVNGKKEASHEQVTDLEVGGLLLEEQLLRDKNTASNAYNFLGMTFGPMAVLRHMHALELQRQRSSMLRSSMNLMDDTVDASLWYDKILFYLHTVTINWILLWVMYGRFCLVLIGYSVEQFTLDQRGLGIYRHVSLNVADLVLAILVTTPIVSTVLIEVAVSDDVQSILAHAISNTFDVFVLTPLLLGCIVLHILNLAGVGKEVMNISKITVVCIWPVLGLLLFWRIMRTIGSRIVLAPFAKSMHGQTRSIDFIWVSKTHEDDRWLIEEMLPITKSNIVRFHRFITRHGPKVEPWMLDYEKVPIKTTYSRPDWDDVFSRLVERSKSGTMVGVFFCGPASMAQMVKDAAMKAMAKSMEKAYQRGYFTKKNVDEIPVSKSESTARIDFSRNRSQMQRGDPTWRNPDGIRKGPMQRLMSQFANETDQSAYGCSVSIVVRIENFS